MCACAVYVQNRAVTLPARSEVHSLVQSVQQLQAMLEALRALLDPRLTTVCFSASASTTLHYLPFLVFTFLAFVYSIILEF